MFCGLHPSINFMTTGTVGKLNVFDLLRAACGCLHWRSARIILNPFKYSDTRTLRFALLLMVLFVLYVSISLFR